MTLATILLRHRSPNLQVAREVEASLEKRAPLGEGVPRHTPSHFPTFIMQPLPQDSL
jgi:hypothetical protein